MYWRNRQHKPTFPSHANLSFQGDGSFDFSSREIIASVPLPSVKAIE
jgi:hypothetical protein